LLQDAEVETAVGTEIFARIPSDRLVPRSVNKGAPVVLEDPRSRVSKVMVELADSVASSAGEVTTDVA
jgi:MinD-like ATPase involved in chromosome partitioning or flagellar assembly